MLKKLIFQLFIKYSLLLLLLFSLTHCEVQKAEESNSVIESTKSQVTFIELGSVNCIPCKMMQPVMKAIEAKYGSQVKVVFYDVWTREQQIYAEVYKIKLIPTQIFLDEKVKEFHRHKGFYPEGEIDKVFQSKGLKIVK
ncbi:MAG: thioredoxin [Ignavibacteriales bacterium CG_4_9_14_3_um_filter_30_11]|nr:MAG: thioredoxin [Ignavibacteriales bacterium CG_4_9_14_3_um_filter_30_11]